MAPLADVAAAVGPGNGGVVTAPRDPTATSTAVPLLLERRTKKTKMGSSDSDSEETLSLLVIRPSARATYFETPQPFNVVAFLKTPYGMLIGFVIFAVFALPRMKIDPDEVSSSSFFFLLFLLLLLLLFLLLLLLSPSIFSFSVPHPDSPILTKTKTKTATTTTTTTKQKTNNSTRSCLVELEVEETTPLLLLL